MFSQTFAGKTKAQTIKLGVRKPVKKHVKECCNKMMNSELLAASIESAAICGYYKNPKSSLKLYQNPYLKKGLVESLLWQCTLCHHLTIFYTSKRCSKNKNSTRNVCETNLCSVYALLNETDIINETVCNDIISENEFSLLERDIKRISFKINEIPKLDIFKDLVNNLHKQLSVLTEDVRYLREDSIKQNNKTRYYV